MFAYHTFPDISELEQLHTSQAIKQVQDTTQLLNPQIYIKHVNPIH